MPVYSHLALPDGTPLLMRPIREDDAAKLVQGFSQLSLQSRYRRFLTPKHHLSPAELRHLTSIDDANRLALGVAVANADGNEGDPIALARYERDPADPASAEVAIVVVDAWQGRGVGRALLRSLAEATWRAGIRRWSALVAADNPAALHLLDTVGGRESRQSAGPGAAEVVYRLFPPVARDADAAPTA